MMPANLGQQIRGSALRDERLDWHRRLSGDAVALPFLAVTSGYCRELANNPLPKSEQLFS
jgi:hypothetical protein